MRILWGYKIYMTCIKNICVIDKKIYRRVYNRFKRKK